MAEIKGKESSILSWKVDTFALVLITCIFLMWGLLTNISSYLLHSNLVYAFKGVTPTDVGLVGKVFFGAYALFGILAALIIDKLGFKSVMILGLSTAALGTVTVIPSAVYSNFTLFIVAMGILGTGVTFLQVAANTYVIISCKPSMRASRLTFVQAFNSFGATLAPIIGLWLFVEPTEMLNRVTSSCDNEFGGSDLIFSLMRLVSGSAMVLPFLIIGVLVFLLAILISFSNISEINTHEIPPEDGERQKETIFQYSHTFFAALAILVYVGAEVSIGWNLYDYIGELDVKNQRFSTDTYVGIYWGLMFVGRFVGAYLLRSVHPTKLVAMSGTTAAFLVFLTISTHSGLTSLYSIVAVGLFNAVLFPCIFYLGVKGLGKFTGLGAGFLITAISGGFFIPSIFGFIQEHYAAFLVDKGNEHGHTSYDEALWVPMICYLLIAFFGLFGNKYKPLDDFEHKPKPIK